MSAASVTILVIVVAAAGDFVYFRSAGKHLDRMANNYQDKDTKQK